MAKVKSLGLEKRVVFAGVRGDVAQLMLDVMDLFLFPSLSEGLGLVVVEAQAAGLPVICSDAIPQEAIVNQQLVKVIELNKSAAIWANTLIQHYDSIDESQTDTALDVVVESEYNLANTLKTLENMWTGKK